MTAVAAEKKSFVYSGCIADTCIQSDLQNTIAVTITQESQDFLPYTRAQR